VLWLNRAKQIVRSIGTAGDCAHDPPRALLEPNGDTPLAGGGVMVTEIGGYVDRFSPTGRLLGSIKTPTDYPSDAQPLPHGNVLVAGYNTPGRIDVMTPPGGSSGPTAPRPALASSIGRRSPSGFRTA
jgi:hypothetical protein